MHRCSFAPPRARSNAPILRQRRYLKYNDVYFLAVTKNNCNAMMTFTFMSHLVRLLRSYIHQPTLGLDLSEGTVRQHFVLVYELLDEICDFGYPQVTDPLVLKQYITQKTLLSKLMASEQSELQAKIKAQNATLQVTGEMAPLRLACGRKTEHWQIRFVQWQAPSSTAWRASSTARTRSTWMSSSWSTCWSPRTAPCCGRTCRGGWP